VNGDTLTLIDSMGSSYPLTIRGDDLYRDGGLTWIWRGTPTTAPAQQTTLAPEQQKAQEDFNARNAVILKNNEIIKTLNADLQICRQDKKDADNASDAETKAAKYGEAEALMLRDTQAKPDAALLWAELGVAQVGLMKYYEAESSFTKALELENASAHPNAQLLQVSNINLANIRGKLLNQQADSVTASAPASQPTHYDAVALPPPPPPPTITTGMTKTQVIAGYGEPQRKAVTGVKEIFFYTELKMKITFTSGKVSNVE
jgi:hypothetical protein